MRLCAHARFWLGALEDRAGHYSTAVQHYEAAVDTLNALGPLLAGASEDAMKAPWQLDVEPCRVLNALGSLHGRMGNTAAALRAFSAALAVTGWPTGTAPGDLTAAMVVCRNLCLLLKALGAKDRVHARLNQWRALLDAAGVAVPSDTAVYLAYALACMQHGEEVATDTETLLATARRVLLWPNLELRHYLTRAANARVSHDTPGALALMEEAVALVRCAQSSRKKTRMLFISWQTICLAWRACISSRASRPLPPRPRCVHTPRLLPCTPTTRLCCANSLHNCSIVYPRCRLTQLNLAFLTSVSRCAARAVAM